MEKLHVSRCMKPDNFRKVVNVSHPTEQIGCAGRK